MDMSNCLNFREYWMQAKSFCTVMVYTDHPFMFLKLLDWKLSCFSHFRTKTNASLKSNDTAFNLLYRLRNALKLRFGILRNRSLFQLVQLTCLLLKYDYFFECFSAFCYWDYLQIFDSLGSISGNLTLSFHFL